MNNFLQKNKHIKIILLLVVTGLLLVVNILVVSHTFKVFNSNKALETNILVLKNKQKQLQSIKQDLKSVLSDYNFLTSLFIEKDSAPDFLQFLETVMRGAGTAVSISSVTSSPLSKENADQEEVTLQFNLNGSRQAVENAIRLLEVFPFKLSLKNISFGLDTSLAKTNNEEDKKKVGTWSAFVTLSVIKNK